MDAWENRHPLTVRNDYGIYATPVLSFYHNTEGWVSKITSKNFRTFSVSATRTALAIRFKSKKEAQDTANFLAKMNKGYKFEVMQMGKLDQ